MLELDREWIIAPHDCIDEEYKEIVPPCSSVIIPGVILYPLDRTVAERIVQDHNQLLKEKGMVKLTPWWPGGTR